MSRASYADPAFPGVGGRAGMSMRQYYTAQALKGLLSNPSITARLAGNDPSLPIPSEVASLALEISQCVMDMEKNQ